MKKIYLLLIILVSVSYGFGQNANEVEPNNSFSTANIVTTYPDVITASIGNGDSIDYFRPDIDWILGYFKNGTVVIHVQATNTGSAPAFLRVEMFNSLRQAGQTYSDVITPTPVMPGATVDRYFNLCAQNLDSVFYAITSNGSFDYEFFCYIGDPQLDDEPNNTAATATNFDIDNITYQSIRYGADTVDYLSTTLPPLASGTATFYVEAKNNSCDDGQWIKYEVFKNGSPVLTGFVGNTQSVGAYFTVESVIPVPNVTVGDVITFRFTSSGAFGYEMHYGDIPATYQDDEDNCCTYNAIPLAEGQVKSGNVGLYDSNNSEVVDEYDTYEINLAQAGAVNLNVKAYNQECYGAEFHFYYDIISRTGNEISTYNQILYWSYPDCNEMRQATIKVRAFNADKFFIRLHADAYGYSSTLMNYELSYTMSDITDNVDTGYNNTVAEATLTVPNQVYKGNVQFKGADYDGIDYYKTIMPADGKMTVIMKAIYRGDNVPYTTYGALNFFLNNSNFTHRTPANGTVSGLIADNIYRDTFQVCGIPGGTATFALYSDFPYEYEFSYVISDTVTWGNDPEPNDFRGAAAPLAQSVIQQGRVGQFTSNNSVDQVDYFRIITPVDGTVKIFVETTNYSCEAGTYFRVDVHDKTNLSSGVDFAKEISMGGIFPAGQTIIDTLSVCGVAADTNYIIIQAAPATNARYRYKIRYELVDTTTARDMEPNNTLAQATNIPTGVHQRGTIGYKMDGNSDYFDLFRFTIATTDTIRIPISAYNASCSSTPLQFNIYRKNQSMLISQNVQGSTPPINTTISDTIKVFVTAPDTLFIRLYTDGSMQYDFLVNPQPPSSAFTIDGDTTACIGTYVYKALGIVDPNIQYHWSLPEGGGILNFTDSIATVNWNENATRKISLYLSNAAGNSITKTRNVIINGTMPTQVPVLYDYARTLSTNTLPPGAEAQWFRNGTAIPGATDTFYYAALAGTYTLKFVNDCGEGPVSNQKVYAANVQAQTISFPHTANLAMSPGLKLVFNATTSSGLGVLYSAVSGPGFVVNDSLNVTGVGTIIVKATQPGNDIFSPAADKFDTITVIKGNQVISFDSIPAQYFSTTDLINITAGITSGERIFYSIVSGNAGLTGSNKIFMTGAGTVTVRAFQDGSADYNAAAPVERSFCIGIRNLLPITGDAGPCVATYRYLAQRIPGANYMWTLSSGGTMITNRDTAWVTWTTAGNHSLKVKANTNCDTIYSTEVVYPIITSSSAPEPVGTMLPANNAINQQLPLTLSWIPGNHTISYDLYVWDSTATEPSTPYASNIENVSFVLPLNSFAYNRTYKWKVIAKNPCFQTTGAIQQFRLIPLADLVMSNVQAPAAANSGQTITINWTVTNAGPGRTLNTQHWTDGVLFSFQPVLDVHFPPLTNPFVWSNLTSETYPLLVAVKPNPIGLESGQSYTNSASFTLPPSYSQPIYVYAVTNYPHSPAAPLQLTVINDSAFAAQPIQVTLSPTPDLRVDEVFTPTTTFSGSKINLTYKVKNYGVLTPAGSAWTDSVFISQNPLFDRQSCIPIALPKADTSYYPNAINGHINVATQLLHDSSYTRNLQVTVPNFISGTWFVYVKTNAQATGGLFEGSFANNNINRAEVQVFLTPTPRLTVEPFSLPLAAASVTQPIGVNWNIRNQGFTDNREKSKGHYLYRVIGYCPCYTSTPNSICVGPPILYDSLTLGSSYWVDRVYLSTNPNGLDIPNAIFLKEVAHGTENAGLLLPDNLSNCVNNYRGEVNVDNVIKPGASYPTAANFNLPSDLLPGNYYVYVYANPNKKVFEFPGTPQIRRSEQPIVVSRPDITVATASSPANVAGGQSFGLNYSIRNIGTGSVFNHIRSDRIYVSAFSSFDASAQLIGTESYPENIPAGDTVRHTFNYSFPAATSGMRYFYIRTNYDSAFKETNYANNFSASAIASTSVTAAQPNDFVVSSIQVPDTVYTFIDNYFKYRVQNNGTGEASGSWKDSVFISCGPVFNRANSIFLKERNQNRVVNSGGSYTDSFYIDMKRMAYELNACFARVPSSPAYVFIKTNADSSVYEGSNLNNNLGVTGAKVLTNYLVDLIVTRVNGPDSGTVGRPFATSWTVRNIGFLGNYYNYYNYSVDAVFFSPDSVAGSNNVVAAQYLKYNQVGRYDTLNDARQVIVPNIPTGDYYVYVHTNSLGNIASEIILNNNTRFLRNAAGAAKKIHITQPVLPDLISSFVAAPTSVAVGQPIQIVRRITNDGAGPTFPASLSNELILSSNFTVNVNGDDLLLNTKIKTGVLNAGASYNDTVSANIRLTTIPGNYVLINNINNTRNVFESNHDNNLSFSAISVYLPPAADLTVSNVNRPDTVLLGYTMDSARWLVNNVSPNAAAGVSTDGIYLSTKDILDSTATLIGLKNKVINMPPISTQSISMAPMITGVVEGNYNLFVRTDLLNNIVESDKDNNVMKASRKLFVKVKELKLNLTETNTLLNRDRFYKFVVPDSLYGSTLRIRLKSNDSLIVKNEMYVGGGYVPSVARFDYRFDTPNYGNQQIIISSVTDSVYYIDVRCVTPAADTQQISLLVEKLPFAILNVNSNRGGNIGNVTVKLSGSLFRDSMTATLTKAGTTITASQVYFTNSTVAYATFNLQGKPLGLYDVTLRKPDNTIATIAAAFTIEPGDNGGLITGSGPNTGAGNGNEPGCDPGAASGLNSQLVVELVVPEQALIYGRPLLLQINYSNPTNYDIAAQSRTLYSEHDMKLAFTKAGVPSGTTSLYMELIEPGGPPGIIRAGASGTITVYTVTPNFLPTSREVIFKFK